MKTIQTIQHIENNKPYQDIDRTGYSLKITRKYAILNNERTLQAFR